MPTRYELALKGNSAIYSELDESDISRFDTINTSPQLIENSKYRIGIFENSVGTAKVITNDRDMIKSSRCFRAFGNGLLNSIHLVNETVEKLKADQLKNIKRAIHNLSSLNAHNIQEVYSFIPQDDGSQTFKARFRGAQKIVTDNTKDAAKTLIRVAQNNTKMKVELSVFGRLLGDNPVLKPSTHKIHKVLINVFYVFFPDFTDKNIIVRYGNCQKSVFVDYESIHAALYYIVENASKYTEPSRDISVEFYENGNDHIEIKISMCSLLILPDELETIFDEGMSGYYAKKCKKSGDGIGMNRAKKLIEHNNGSISLVCFGDTRHTTENLEYQDLDILIKLPKNRGMTQTV
jgi:light-regulated signal transduction histidine kinase (bacteriophytochrome)